MQRQPRLRFHDSGVPWIGTIPATWELIPLKRLGRFESGENITAESIDVAGQYPVYGGNGLRGYTESYSHEGDYVLVGRQGALCGNVNYASGKFWASEHAVTVKPKSEVAVQWLGELLRAMKLGQYSQSAAQPGLSVEFVVNLKVPVPPPEEQRAIAAFLDRKTAQIDAVVAKKQRLIERLQEKRQALISHAVTKGLDPHAPMKDSGIEWLGEIPAHWLTAPLYTRYLVQLGKMLDARRITGEHLAPYLRNVDVQWGFVNTEELPEMDFTPDERKRFRLQLGDLVVCEGGEVGRCAIWREQLAECYYQKAIHRLRPKSPHDLIHFFFYVMKAAAHSGTFVAGGNPNTIDHLTAEKLRSHRFAFPPLPEQQAIAAFLDRKTAQIDDLTRRLTHQITKLQEYRQTLISAAVTGKIDVTQEAAYD